MAKSRKKKKRFWKWILISGAALLVIGMPTGYFGAKYYLKQRTLGLRKQGMAYMAANDYQNASDYLARYLHRYPEDLEALETYVHARELTESPDGQNIAETISALKRILGQKPDSLEYSTRLLNLYMLVQRRPEGLATANSILDPLSKAYPVISKMPAPQRAIYAKTLGIKTELLTAMHQDREALTLAEQWIIAAQPGEVRPQMARITSRFLLGQQPESIIQDVKKLVDSQKNDARAELLLGYAYLRAHNGPESLSWLKAAASHIDPNADYVKIMIAQFDTLGITNDTLAVLKNLVDRGASPEIRHFLGLRHWELGQYEPAVAMFSDVLSTDPKADPTLLAIRAIALSNRGQTAEAQEIRAALTKQKGAAARAWTLLLPRILDGATVDDKTIALACRQALGINDTNAYLMFYLGDANSRMGEIDLAMDAWGRAVNQNPAWAAPATRLVQALLQKGKPEAAYEIARKSAAHSPNNIPAALALARAWAVNIENGSASNSDELLAWLKDIQEKLPEENEPLLIRAELLARSGKPEEATQIIRTALAQTPPPREIFLTNFASISRRFNLHLENECFALSEKLYSLTPNLALARALDRSTAANPQDGLRLFDELADKAGKSSELPWKLARARFLDISGNETAPAALKSLGEEFPDDLAVQTFIVNARSVAGNWEVLPPAIERLHRQSGDNSFTWRLVQARLYVTAPRSEDDFVQGSLQLSNILRDGPGIAEAHVLLAHALIYMKRMDGALEHLDKAVQIDPDSVPYALQRASLYRTQGDSERAQKEIERITPLLFTTNDRRQAAMILAQSGAPDRALGLIQPDANATTLPDEKDDFLMAILYHQKNQNDQAEVLVKKLMAKPTLEAIQFGSGFYMALGRRADAEKCLRALDEIKLDPGVKEMLWGNFYVQLSEGAKALEKFQAAIQQSPSNSTAWRSLVSVQVLLNQGDDALKTIAQGAKAVPADKGLEALFKQSDLLHEAQGDLGLRSCMLLFFRDPLGSQEPIEMMKVVVEARQAHDMDRLASQLQQFIERHTDFLPAYIRLAQCYDQMHRENDALQTAQHAMTVFPTNPEPARVAAQVAAAAGLWAEMRTAAETWKKRSNDVAANVALARALIGLEQYDGARLQLEPFIPLAKANPDQFSSLLSSYACIAVNLGKPQEAADLLWPMAQKNAEWRALCLDMANAVHDPDKAQTWLDRVAGIIPKDATKERLALAEDLDLLGRRKRDPVLVKKATELAAEIARAAPQDLLAQLITASQAERNGDAVTAETFYRRALVIDPNHPIANNELALLVLQRADGDPKEALALAKVAAIAQPRNANILDTYALTQFRDGDPKAATESIQIALKLEPDNLAYQIRLAQYLFEAGDRAQAIAKVHEIDRNRAADNPPPALRQELEAIRKRAKDKE